MKEKIILISLSFALIVLAVVLTQQPTAKGILGSIGQASEYHSTTTSPTSYSFSSGDRILNSAGYGSLGSIIVTGVGSAGGNIEFFDATTTNPSLRASSMSSTTQLVASFPTNLAVGTYVIDASVTYGLIMVIRGTVGTTTVTYR